MKKYKRLLFDVDGTLLDFKAAERHGLEHLFEKYGADMIEPMIARYQDINHSLWDAYEKGEIKKSEISDSRFVKLYEEFYIKDDGIEAERLYRQQLNQSGILKEGARKVCKALSARYELYVVTNGFTKTQKLRLNISGLEPYFHSIFVSEEAGSQKPQKEFFEYCFSHMKAPKPESMLLIGDSLQADIRGGNLAGIDTCWYNPNKEKNTLDVTYNYEIHKLHELLQLL